jgi:prepilin-type processing-associated H-X9-DG protein
MATRIRGSTRARPYVVGGPLNQYTGTQAPNPFGPGGPSANDVTAGLFLLLRTQDITSEVFICPSTNLTPYIGAGMNAQTLSNFPGNQNLAYSMSNTYPNQSALALGYKMNATTGAEFAIVADMNPGGTVLPTLTPQSPMAQLRGGNSKNHGGAGQNVLYGDGHVEFQQTSFCGLKQDCIYTVATPPTGGWTQANTTSSTISGSPTWAGDSVLLPVATIDPGYFSANSMLVYLIVGFLALGGLIGLILWLVLRNRKPSQSAVAGQPYFNAPPPAVMPPQRRQGPPPPQV